jgi:hypothetical protein
VSLAPALFVVQVGPAVRAQAAAVASAYHFQRQSQQHLLLYYVGQEESFSLEKPDFGIVVLQAIFPGLEILNHRPVKEVKGPAHILYDWFQAPGTYHFDLRFQVAGDTDLAIQKLGGCRYFQRLGLLDIGRMEIDASGSVALPDAQFTDGKILNVKEHVFSASGAYAHAFSLLGRSPLKSRNTNTLLSLR